MRSLPVIVGLTGSIGMGKSTASQWCRRAGILVHDADACVHKLYGPGGAAVEAVGRAFPGVVSAEGVDRQALSAAVAAAGRDSALKTLEGIVHPLVTADRQAFISSAAAAGTWCVVLDIPLLLETMDAEARAKLLDALVVVSAPAQIQRARVLERQAMTEEKLSFILSKQVPDADKRAAADFVIETGFDSFAPARAQLSACFQALAAKHSDTYARWLATPPVTTSADAPPAAAPPAAVRAVTLDLDDTCWPTLPPILAATRTLTADMEELLPKTAAAGYAEGKALREAISAVVSRQPLVAHDMSEMRRAALAQLAAEHADVDADAAVTELMRRFVRARSDVASHFYADTVPSVQQLRQAGLPVGALTNGNADVRQHDEVSALFDFAVAAGAAPPLPPPRVLRVARTHADVLTCAQAMRVRPSPTRRLSGWQRRRPGATPPRLCTLATTSRPT